MQWQRSAIYPKDSFAEQSADLKHSWVFEGKTLKALVLILTLSIL
ncbi:MAG: hypothetical protein PHG19_12650 [Anaerotignum sp.]|nr:hypothetical protein [Anaerotignum sp.]